ncbi:unnamed protein product [Leptosia nina]|uniref:Uncharacterized protein n=1 Tax=Leptosia nina TaxID=320188 RepID=A0AAV1J8U9_9NEOP
MFDETAKFLVKPVSRADRALCPLDARAERSGPRRWKVAAPRAPFHTLTRRDGFVHRTTQKSSVAAVPVALHSHSRCATLFIRACVESFVFSNIKKWVKVRRFFVAEPMSDQIQPRVCLIARLLSRASSAQRQIALSAHVEGDDITRSRLPLAFRGLKRNGDDAAKAFEGAAPGAPPVEDRNRSSGHAAFSTLDRDSRYGD